VALPVITAVPLVASNVCEPEKLEPLMLVVCALADEHAIDMVSMTAAATCRSRRRLNICQQRLEARRRVATIGGVRSPDRLGTVIHLSSGE
jgi:hypothetical protein